MHVLFSQTPNGHSSTIARKRGPCGTEFLGAKTPALSESEHGSQSRGSQKLCLHFPCSHRTHPGCRQ
eukprot:3941815-Rhodomonas_salina.3